MSILCSLYSLDILKCWLIAVLDTGTSSCVDTIFFCTIAHIIHDDNMTVYTSLFATALPYTVDGLNVGSVASS